MYIKILLTTFRPTQPISKSKVVPVSFHIKSVFSFCYTTTETFFSAWAFEAVYLKIVNDVVKVPLKINLQLHFKTRIDTYNFKIDQFVGRSTL